MKTELLKYFNIKIILLCFLIYTQSNSQQLQDNFVHFTEADGLPANNIHPIMQDQLGYLWFGTHNGLSRYDGNGFYNFSVVNDTNNFLQLPVITALYEDSNGIIWIGAVGGVTKYNRDNGTFKLYNSSDHIRLTDIQINDFEETPDGDIFFAASDYNYFSIKYGLYKIDGESNKLIPLTIVNDDSTGGIMQISRLNKSEYLISGARGFGKYNYKEQIVTWFPLNIETVVISFIPDENNIYWLGTLNQGIIRYDLTDNSYTTFPVLDNFNPENDFFVVNKIIYDENNNLLCASNKGLIHFNCITHEVSLKSSDTQNRSALHTNYLNNIFLDRSGSIWLSTFDAGISKYNLVENNFQAYSHNPNDPNSVTGWILDFLELSNNEIWLNNGFRTIMKYDIDGNNFTHYDSPRINEFYKDSNGNVWIVGGDGAFLVDVNSWKFKNLNIPIDLSPNQLTGVLEDSRSTIWLSSYDGLFTYDRESNSVAKIDFQKLGIGSDISKQVIRMVEDTKGNLWFGTEDGLFKFDIKEKQYSRIGNSSIPSQSLLSQNINSLYADIFGKIWVGTWLGGLNSYDPVTDKIESFGKNQGLNSHSVQAILGDENNGALWLSTFNGISRFDIEKITFSNFGIEDGLQASQFADGSKLKTSNGEFLFGGANGFTKFKPEEIESNIVPPKVVITDFKLFNKTVIPGENSQLENPIYETEKIVLNHDENDIAFDYFAVHYVNPSKNQYAYKLDNYEDEWRFVGSQRTAIYPNLPPGNYVFHLKASNNNEVWNEEGVSIGIEILSPWWYSWWVYLCYFLMILLFLYSLRKFELNRKMKNAKIKESQFRAETAELQAKAAEAQALVIQSENDRKTKELEEARQLQLSMLPKELPKIEDLDIAVYMKTATEVGGDYYDFSQKEDGSLNIAIGDATGHGMKAGTLVSMIKSLFTANSINKSIGDFFSSSNEALKNAKLDRMMMAFTMLNISGNKIEIANAGIPPVFIYRKGKEEIEEISVNGLPLGAMYNSKYEIYKSDLSEDDVILMLSDGFPELQNEKNEQYGYERTKSTFQLIANKSAEEIIAYMKDEGSKWVNDQDPDDDVTFVVIKVK